MNIVPFRFYDAIYGVSAERLNIDYEDKNMIPPDHFGYQNETISRNFYNIPKYLILNDVGRDFYLYIYPEFKNKWRFLNKDFERVNFDNKIQKLYSNRNLEIFKISQ